MTIASGALSSPPQPPDRRDGVVVPFRGAVPCATGTALGIPVEIHLRGPLGRAVVALHELHELAELRLHDVDGDELLAVASAADDLARQLHDELSGDVAIAVGAHLDRVSTSAVGCRDVGDSAVVVHQGGAHVAIGTAHCDRGDVATATSSTAAASVRVARSVLVGRPGRFSRLGTRGSVLLIRSDGTVEAPPRQ